MIAKLHTTQLEKCKRVAIMVDGWGIKMRYPKDNDVTKIKVSGKVYYKVWDGWRPFLFTPKEWSIAKRRADKYMEGKKDLHKYFW